MDTREVVQDLLGRIGEGDPDRIAEAYAERVDWRLDWPAEEHGGEVPWIRPRSTRAEVADHFRSIASHHEQERAAAEIERILVDGPDAVVLGTIVNRVRRTGRDYRAHFALHLTVDGEGLVNRHHIYEDSLSVARAWAG
ncbi:nuclear transport factor 2 family protein [Plantactinospora sp. GCM10030261]|uniref:nuclear transport factor 2 family protein n=1 Tax=Plantactinospora sp. GCM10030261 TaxID=3273420 RepID=UPI00361C3677